MAEEVKGGSVDSAKWQVDAMAKYFEECESRTPYIPENEENASGKIVIVTGSNSGIGEAAALGFAKRGAIVVMACRDLGKAEQALQNIKAKAPKSQVELLELDLGDLSSVRKCAQTIQGKFDHIDLLINNAGVVFKDGILHKTKDGFESHFGINHLGHFLFTGLLLDLLTKGKSSRIVNVSSGLYELSQLDLNDLMLEKVDFSQESEKMLPYSNSKLANVYFTRTLAKKLEKTNVNVYALCPGLVKTDIMRNSGGWQRNDLGPKYLLTPEEGAETILYCSLSKDCAKESGLIYRFLKPFKTTRILDDDFELKLWERSENLVGLKY